MIIFPPNLILGINRDDAPDHKSLSLEKEKTMLVAGYRVDPNENQDVDQDDAQLKSTCKIMETLIQTVWANIMILMIYQAAWPLLESSGKT